VFRGDIRFQSSAIATYQEASETYPVGLFEDTNHHAIDTHGATMMEGDVELAQNIRSERN
jgi:histone H3